MSVQLPIDRSYYSASPNEPDVLLCWIPPSEVKELIVHGQIDASVLEDYPLGLEIRVTEDAFHEVGLNLDIAPERLSQAFQTLRRIDGLDASGAIRAVDLEDFATRAERTTGGEHDGLVGLSEPFHGRPPRMSEGEDALIVLRRIAREL